MSSKRNKHFNYRPYLADHGLSPCFSTSLGVLFHADCMEVLPQLKSASVDLIFADPPFNLNKHYGARGNDRKLNSEYLSWCRDWLHECYRLLKPGGSIFVYNLPRWNIHLGSFLNDLGLEFRHWISIETSNGLPIAGRLYPSHYSLLYYSKKKPKTFRRIRTPLKCCRHCGKELKDYGGYRGLLHPAGIALKDVWTDVPPVRHAKYKSSIRHANALSTKILDRVIEMASEPGDLVLDPFGGSGTTFAVCEAKRRHWLGVEINGYRAIVNRLTTGNILPHPNDDVVEIKERTKGNRRSKRGQIPAGTH